MTAEFYALRISLLRTKFGGLLRRNTLDKLFVSRWLAGNVPSCTVSVVDVVKECAPKRYVDLYAVVSTLSSPYLQAAGFKAALLWRSDEPKMPDMPPPPGISSCAYELWV